MRASTAVELEWVIDLAHSEFIKLLVFYYNKAMCIYQKNSETLESIALYKDPD